MKALAKAIEGRRPSMRPQTRSRMESRVLWTRAHSISLGRVFMDNGGPPGLTLTIAR